MSVILSDEQQKILQEAKEPGVGSTIRITSAAGTGKTTTLLELAQRFSQLGHRSITYITFNKSAAADARKRLDKKVRSVVAVDARTLHSCAMSLLATQRREAMIPEERLLNEEQLQKEIGRRSQNEIDKFLRQCYREIAGRRLGRGTEESMRKNAYRQVVFFIFKTLRQFCMSALTEEEWSDPRNDRKRNYYPASTYHSKRDGDGEKAGFPQADYQHQVGFYADQACALWNAMKDVNTYDFEMKRAQLANLEIPGTALLVDECQDMDGCQIEWVSSQVKFNKQVIFVGDAAQTIYSFRGAKSRYMMNLKGKVVDCTLTKSWRFGPNIATVANMVLFAKQKSPQTTGSYTKTWQPYRVTGAGPVVGTVTSESLLPKWKTQKVTILAFTNVALLMQAVTFLGYTRTREEDEEGDEPVEAPPPIPFDASMIPKFHINGRGESSGLKKWKQILKELEHLYLLYTAGEDLLTLPGALFSEFANQKVSWTSFTEQVKNRELNRYAASVMVVTEFRKDTMKVIQLFEENVMEKNYSVEDSDVVLSTCHAAKGMEWDHVQVCSNFVDLAKLNAEGPPISTAGSSKGQYGKRQKGRPAWQFAFKSYGDDVNLLYVACTRAKKILSVPKGVLEFLQQCDLMQQMLDAHAKAPTAKDKKDKGTVIMFGREKPLTMKDLKNIQNDIVGPLRQECKIFGKVAMCNSILSDEMKQANGGSVKNESENMPSKMPAKKSTDRNARNDKSNRVTKQEVIDISDSPERIAASKPSTPEPEIIVID
jgi:superfamily I DNA/RNA helicase